MKQKTKDTLVGFSERTDWRNVLLSMGISFTSAFLLALAALLPDNFSDVTMATTYAMLSAAAYAGVKALIQYLIIKFK